MYAVIFEVEPEAGRVQDYLDIAARLRPELEKIDGFISIERFKSLSQERQDPVVVVLARRGRDRALAPTGRAPGGATHGARPDLSRLPDPRRRRDARLRHVRAGAGAAVDAAKIQAGIDFVIPRRCAAPCRVLPGRGTFRPFCIVNAVLISGLPSGPAFANIASASRARPASAARIRPLWTNPIRILS